MGNLDRLRRRPEQPRESGHDSFVRNFSDGPTRKTAEFLYEKFPNLTPNQISIIGAISTVTGDAIIHSQNRKERKNYLIVGLGLVSILAGEWLDGVDGKSKDIFVENGRADEVGNNGPLVDLICDRIREVLRAFIRAKTARLNEDPIGEALALAAAITAPLPRLATAQRNAHGEQIEEIATSNEDNESNVRKFVKKAIATLGSRIGKGTLNTLASLTHRNQAEIEIATVGATLVSANMRRTADTIETLSDEKVKDAKRTRNAMGTITGAATGGVVYRIARNMSKK